jgi:hypothetical protein
MTKTRTEPEKTRIIPEIDANAVKLTVPGRYPAKVYGARGIRGEEDELFVRTELGRNIRYFHGPHIGHLVCLSCGELAKRFPGNSHTYSVRPEAREIAGSDRFYPPSCNCVQAMYDYNLAHRFGSVGL